MHYLNEQNIFLFLVQISLLWIFARGLGELFRKWKQPTITAEILTGILLGPTILGRVSPAAYNWIFPRDVIQQNMLETVAWVGILFFLLKTGLEMDFSSAWRQRKHAVTISISDVVIPMIIAFIPTVFIAPNYLTDPSHKYLLSLFIATIMTISALPVTARVLQDLNLYKTDVGFLIMGALSLNDIIGWAVFTMVLGIVTQASFNIASIGIVLFSTVAFSVFCLTGGKHLTNLAITKMQKMKLPEPGSSLTVICLIGSICGAITLKIGIHALFGFFIAGIMAGEAKALSEKTRNIISQMVHSIFIPLFFANIGLKSDFLKNIDWFLIAFITIIGIAGRYLGAWLGVTFTNHHRVNRSIIAIAHTPGGEMQIVVGILALEYGLIKEPVFVAIVFGAILSSVIIGPWMSIALKQRKKINIIEFFGKRLILPELKAIDRDNAIRELSELISEQENMPSKDEVFSSVITREDTIGTGLEEGVAIPHARMANIKYPLIAVGRSFVGIDWNSPDGKLTNLVFMILTPQDDDWVQLQILRYIAIALKDWKSREILLNRNNNNVLWEDIRKIFETQYIQKKPKQMPRLNQKGAKS
ncbi:MAG: cation:proton antiporter [Candidatus Omnitrophica bacterium]|nr:cation:proton antiporter [Candidatus Omnitrophota bacterium]